MAPPIRTCTPLGRLLVAYGWSVAELSRVSGVYARTLSNYLGGTPIIDSHLVRIADALDVDPEDLLDFDPDTEDTLFLESSRAGWSS